MIDPSGNFNIFSGSDWSDLWHDFERSSTGQAICQATAAIVGTALGSLIGHPELGVVFASAMSAGTNYAFTGNLTSAVQAGVTTAITAGAFYEAGNYLQGLQGGGLPADASYAVPYPVTTSTQVAVHAAAGATAGGINAAITGGNIGLGAVAGGFSGGMGSYFRGFTPFGSEFAGHALVGGATGGAVYSLYGKSFGEGFAVGAATSVFELWYNYLKHTGSYRVINGQATPIVVDTQTGRQVGWNGLEGVNVTGSSSGGFVNTLYNEALCVSVGAQVLFSGGNATWAGRAHDACMFIMEKVH